MENHPSRNLKWNSQAKFVVGMGGNLGEVDAFVHGQTSANRTKPGLSFQL